MRQVFLARNPKLADDLAFERKLYVIRKRAENAIRYSGKVAGGDFFYVSSLSYKTVVYKGMLLTEQLSQYYPDLSHPAMESALALVHSRFSTNTFPSWDRAHPYRYIAHNGEINTLRGNINWMHARQALFESDLFGDDLKKILPVICTDGSDSAMFDNCLELLVLAGRSLPHAMMMMIPEPWTKHESMSAEKKAFYEYHSCLMEPWDGPASIAFTDGRKIGAVLDRNGLRPSRYYVTKDDLVIMASEVGVLDVPAERVLQKGRLQPGRMFLIDTEEGRIVADEEIKQKIATAHPYREWLDQNLIRLADVPDPRIMPQSRTTRRCSSASRPSATPSRTCASSWRPWPATAPKPSAPWAPTRPLAVLSNKSAAALQLLQAALRPGHQPADRLHPRGNHHLHRDGHRLGAQPAQAHARTRAADRTEVPHPHERGIRQAQAREPAGLQVRHLPHPVPGGRRARPAWKRPWTSSAARSDQAIEDGVNIIILSDRGVNKEWAPIPALLAVVRPAPPPDPRGHAHPGRPRARIRRAARGAPFLAADRLRLRRHQSVPGLRDPRRHDPPGAADRHRPQDRLQELPQGRDEGRRQGDLEDGHLHHPELLRRADLRGRRPEPASSSTSISPGRPPASRASAST